MDMTASGVIAPFVTLPSAEASSAPVSDFGELSELLKNITPLSGKLQAIRTKAEAEAGLKLIDAHIVCVQARDANGALKLIDAAISTNTVSNLQHLRRVAKAEFLPSVVKARLEQNLYSSDEQSPLPSPVEVAFPRSDSRPSRDRTTSGTSSSSKAVSRPPSTSRTSASSASRPPSNRSGSSSSSRRRRRRSKSLYLVACPTSIFTTDQLSQALISIPHASFIQPVPSAPPSTQDEAQAWSKDYWPTIYKAHNPFGPQPVFISRAQEALAPFAGQWIKLARDVAQETFNHGYGLNFGAVIINPRAGPGGAPAPVAAAGDARWKGYLGADRPDKGVNGCPNGNPTGHAAMRAIGMVARQRVALAEHADAPTGRREHVFRLQRQKENLRIGGNLFKDKEPPSIPSAEQPPASIQTQNTPNSTSGESIFLDTPLLHTENVIYQASPLPGGGYLCSGLEIWLSHEPCVMCSMALLHSRFERVVFGRRMHETGGLCGDKDGLGLGLFWRPELNWKMTGWRWVDDEVEDENEKACIMVENKVHV